jgi:acetolactate synthase-1/2/3 large subunit
MPQRKKSADMAMGRRDFLCAVTFSGAAAANLPAVAAEVPAAAPSEKRPHGLAAKELPPEEGSPTQTSSGADFMVEVLRSLGLDYLAVTPDASFRGFQEAIINYAGNRQPELLTCLHEEVGVGMAHGYAKTSGKPLGVLIGGTVGLQHATMAIYNAYCDRAPICLFLGNWGVAADRKGGVEWAHSAQSPASLVRDFSKWDDQPATLQDFAEATTRAHKIAMTAPMGPVLLTLNAKLQEAPLPADKLTIPRRPRIVMPQAERGALLEAAKLLVNADHPVLIADRLARTPAGMAGLIELAELLQCAVLDQGGRMNFPWRHPLNQTVRGRAVITQADLLVGLELNDFSGMLHTFSDRLNERSTSLLRPNAKTISIGTIDLFIKSNYQEFQRFADVDLAIIGDGEASLADLIALVRPLISRHRQAAFAVRGRTLAQAHEAAVQQARLDAAIGWNVQPITTARLCAEVYDQIRHEDWSLIGAGVGIPWPRRLWAPSRHDQWIGGSGGGGLGYTPCAALGAALARRERGQINLVIQGDGDFMFAPSVLWTAAHHRLPVLYLMYNNRAYHQETMYIQMMANRRSRGIDRSNIGTEISDPNIDFATVAKGFGVYAQGPVTDPAELAAALRRAISVVKGGEPALVDVIVQR